MISKQGGYHVVVGVGYRGVRGNGHPGEKDEKTDQDYEAQSFYLNKSLITIIIVIIAVVINTPRP